MPTSRSGELSSCASFFSGGRPSRLFPPHSKGHVAAKGNTHKHVWQPICDVMTNAAGYGPPAEVNLEHDKGGFEIELPDASEGRAMAPAIANKLARDLPPLRPPYAPPDEAIAAELLASAGRGSDAEARIDARGTRLVEAIRARTCGLGAGEGSLQPPALSTKEGLALMVLAEALLRVPDAETADRLIEDKLGQGDFAHTETRSDAFLVNASAWALGVTARIIQPGETPEGILGQLAKRLGVAAARAATPAAIRGARKQL